MADLTTADRLREYLAYDPLTGHFTRRKKKNHVVGPVGAKLGSNNGNGYERIVFDGRHYFTQRLAWLYMTGSWPDGHIDHKNGNPMDNRWSNLRDATVSQNHANSKRQSNNTSGLKGASYSKANGRWLSQITKQGRYIYLGYHDTAEAAHAAYVIASTRINGEFARVA